VTYAFTEPARDMPGEACVRCGYESDGFRLCLDCAEDDEIERADGADAWEVEMREMYGDAECPI
jgi:hypothetical protein